MNENTVFNSRRKRSAGTITYVFEIGDEPSQTIEDSNSLVVVTVNSELDEDEEIADYGLYLGEYK